MQDVVADIVGDGGDDGEPDKESGDVVASTFVVKVSGADVEERDELATATVG